MLADTPPTILPMLILAFSGMASPAIALWSVILTIRASSRRFGVFVIVTGVIGSALCSLAWSLLSLFVHEPISTVGASMWLFLVAGGFGSFGTAALFAGYAFGVFRTRKV